MKQGLANMGARMGAGHGRSAWCGDEGGRAQWVLGGWGGAERKVPATA